MNKKILLSFLSFLFVSFTYAQTYNIEGDWYNEDKDAIIKIYKDMLIKFIKMTESRNDKPIQIYDGEIGEYIGRVKWFSKPKGFGFITIINDEEQKIGNTEVFCHFSNIMSENYKILFSGEFVSCDVKKNDKDGRLGCFNVRGLNGYPLLIDNEESHHRSLPKTNNQRNTVKQEVQEEQKEQDDDYHEVDDVDDPEN